MCIREVSREQRKQQEGRYLCETNIAEHDRGPGLEIQIPAHGDGEHLKPETREEVSSQKQAIIAKAE
jgi:hypothetical protein